MNLEANVEYRLLQPHQEGALFDLWCELFPDTVRQRWRDQFAWDPDRFQQSYVAVDPEDNLLSTIRYFIRSVRDVNGQPLSVGWVTNVATKATAQRQGHAGKLLALAVDAMRQKGCRWALLSADEDAAGFYEQHGWRRFPYRYRQGLLAHEKLPESTSYRTSFYNPQHSGGWQQVAAIYEQYNWTRPLTVVRDQSYWDSYVAMRVADWQEHAGAQLLVATPRGDGSSCSGYAIAMFSEMGVLVSELCVLPDEPEAIPVLLNGIRNELRRRAFPEQGRVYLPHDSVLDRAIEQFFDATLHEGYDSFLLARSLVEGDESEIEAAFAAPHGIHWLLDDY